MEQAAHRGSGSGRAQSGFRMVKPPKKRKQQDTPSRRTREARRLAERIETTTAERRDAYVETSHPNATEALARNLDDLYRDKRVARRDVYREAPQLEGRPVFKGQPGGRS